MAIQDPEVLAWDLYAEGVVTDSAIDKGTWLEILITKLQFGTV